MNRDELILLRLKGAIKAEVPDFEVKVKEDSGLMKFYNFFLQLFNKNFMTGFVTTSYPKVYFPEEMLKNPRLVWHVLAHEFCHLRNAKKQTFVLNTFLYIFPQVLVALSALSFLAIGLGPWWLLNLLWLLCAAPLPAPGRMVEEMGAYRMSMATWHWSTENVDDLFLERIGKSFYGPFYYFMWPFKTSVMKRLRQERQNIVDGKYDEVEPYCTVKKIIDETKNNI